VPVKVHINSLDLTLIIVPIKEALELQKYFVQTVAKFSVARVVCLGSDVTLKVLDIIKRKIQTETFAIHNGMSPKLLADQNTAPDVVQFLTAKGNR
jgi:hypothetical protein